MKKQITLYFGWALLMVLGIYNLAASVRAHEGEHHFTLAVSPSTGYIQVKPGTEVIHSVIVSNKGSEPVTIVPRVVDFEADGKTGEPVLAGDTTFPYLANQETVLVPVTIEPGGQANLPFVIKPPSTAPLHEYHLTILFEHQHAGSTSQPDSDSPATSTLVPTIGSNLVVLVAGDDQRPQLKIESLQRLRVLDSFRPLVFTPLARNDGDAAVIASGSARIKDWRGRVVAQFSLYPDVVLAESSRELRAAREAAPVLPDDPDASIATLLEPVPFSYTSPLLLGPYSIEFALTTETPDGITTATQQFTVIALPLSALVILGLTGGVIIGLRSFNKKKKHHTPEEKSA